MVYAKEIYKGRFIPRNRLKYLGKASDIIYRSSYELKFMNWCDLNESVIGWVSEEIVIPYRSPLDKRIHKYYIDFYAEIKQANGVIKKYLIEVKPKRFTKPPEPRRKTKKYLQEVAQWGVNEAKWNSAKQFCKKQNMEFMIITEKELGI